MRVFAIGDLHLGRPMDKFGQNWRDHDGKIFASWRDLVRDEDLVLICGDTSWARNYREALPHLQIIDKLPGQKIIVRGNHCRFFPDRGPESLRRLFPPSLHPLHKNSYVLDDFAVIGARGWMLPGDPYFDKSPDENRKIFQREVQRFKASIQDLIAKGGANLPVVVVFHFPPLTTNVSESKFVQMVSGLQVRHWVYGHLHGEHCAQGIQGVRDGIEFHLVSCDHVNFAPKLILESSSRPLTAAKAG